MFDKQATGNELFSDDSQALLRQLERNTADKVQKMRAHERIEMRIKIVIRPGSMSQRDEWSIEGVTGDVSRGGAKILLPRPLHVGDIFQVVFDPKILDVTPQLCLSQWCRTIRSDAYECGLSFFSPIDLQAGLRSDAS